jgi:hypothetical protein
MNRPTLTTIIIIIWVVLAILSVFGPALGVGIGIGFEPLAILGLAILMLR